MRRLVIVTAMALLGGCASAPAPRPASVPAPAPPPEARSGPAQRPTEAPPAPAVPQRPAAVRVDNSSLETFRTSWQRLRASLSPTQQATLNSAVAALAFDRYGSVTDLPRNLRDNPIVPEMIRHRIDGMSYAEIVDLSREPPAP